MADLRAAFQEDIENQDAGGYQDVYAPTNTAPKGTSREVQRALDQGRLSHSDQAPVVTRNALNQDATPTDAPAGGTYTLPRFGRAELSQAGKEFVQNSKDLAGIWSAEASLYGYPALVGLGEGALSMAKGGSFKEGYNIPFEKIRMARERQNTGAELLAGMMPGPSAAAGALKVGLTGAVKGAKTLLEGADHLGDATGMSWGNLRDELMSVFPNAGRAAQTHRTTPNSKLRSMGARLEQEALTGFGMGAVSGYLETGDLGESMKQAMTTMAASGAGQLVLGEIPALLNKYGLSSRRVAAKNGAAMLDAGLGSGNYGMRPGPMRGELAGMSPEKLYLEMNPPGTDKADLITRTIENIANATFPKGLAGQETGAIIAGNQRFARALQNVTDASYRVNDALKTRVEEVVGQPVSTSKYYQLMDRNLSGVRERYRAFTDRTNMQTGGRPLSYGKYAEDFNDKLLSVLPNRKQNVTGTQRAQQIGPEAAEMERAFLEMLRPQNEHTITQQFGKKVAGNAPYDQRGSLGNLLTADLVEARSRFATRYLGTGHVLRGVDASQRKMATQVLKAIDDTIMDRMGVAPGAARQEYAKYMGMRDAFENGKTLYNAVHVEEAASGKYFLEYLDSLPADQQQALKDGYKSAVAEAIMIHDAPMVTFQKMFGGEMGKGVPRESWFRTKEGNLDILNAVLGKDGVEALQDVYTQDVVLAESLPVLRELLKHKQKNPQASVDLVRDMDEMIVAHALGPGGSAITQNAVMGALARRFEQMNAKDSMFMLDMIGAQGPEQRNAVVDYALKAAERPIAFRQGARFGAGVGSIARPEGPSGSDHAMNRWSGRDFAMPTLSLAQRVTKLLDEFQ